MNTSKIYKRCRDKARSWKPSSYEEALILLKQVYNANYLHLLINHKLN